MAEKKGLPQTGGKGGKDDNGKNEKFDKKFFENLFAPLKESVSNFANTIREQGGSQVSEGFKQLGLTSGPAPFLAIWLKRYKVLEMFLQEVSNLYLVLSRYG